MKPCGMSRRSSRAGLVLLVAFLALLIMPCSVSGATPPPLPSLTLSASNATLSGDEDLVLSAAWSRDASFYRPPRSIDVLIYSTSSGSLVAGYTIPGDDPASAGDTARHFRGTVPSSELPEGRLLLVAVDPVSGAGARTLIDVAEPGPDYPAAQAKRYAETAFFAVAGVLLAVLVAGLALLLRHP